MSRKEFNHKIVEAYWRTKWIEEGVYIPDINTARKPFFNLWMFPYPSAEGLHAGHAFASTGSDVIGRFTRMSGNDVFQPMVGYDSFGIHAENYALSIGEHPMKMLERVTKNYGNQMLTLGHGYDWTRSVTTSDVNYYKWTQWLFIQLFKAGLAYRKKASVNWCPSCKTVLADEQVMTPAQAGKDPKNEKGERVEMKDGLVVCERCGTVIEIKSLEQWFFRITDYADKLLENLGKIDWPEKIKIAQRNWIGKKEGINITYPIADSKLQLTNHYITVWTSRPDTNFGATFIVASPEYAKENLLDIISKDKKNTITKYINISLNKSKNDRITEGRDKTGVFTGLYAVNQLNGYEMPIWITDFVLADVGTGAVVGVPAHDERDFDFARRFNLHIRKVIDFDKETHSVILKKSVGKEFIADVEENGWYWMDYEDWGYGVVLPSRDDAKYIKTVQKHLLKGLWYVHTDGSLKSVIFKDKTFKLPEENNESKEYARNYKNIPEDQLDWDNPDKYMFCYTGEGKVVNSMFLDGLSTQRATKKIMDYLEKKGWGERTTNYHLRDWLVSRQRYWGAPIPMIYCEECAKEGKSWFTQELKNRGTEKTRNKGEFDVVPQKQVRASHNANPECGDRSNPESLSDLSKDILLHNDQSDWNPCGWYPEENLPVELPNIKDFKPKGEGRGPLANHPEFYETTCPCCGSTARRETDVLDTFVDSSWYFLRYPSVCTNSKHKSRNPKQTLNTNDSDFKRLEIPWDREITWLWLPVNLYFGGAEHSVLHLMYSRFVTMVFNDLGYISFDEPFPWFYAHGLMIKDGAKMSKSRGNVVNPDIYIEKFGADTLRLYLMFMGPMDGYPDFRDTGIEGMRRFIDRVWGIFNTNAVNIDKVTMQNINIRMHQTIKKVSEDIQIFRYNTAIAAIMEYVNLLREISQRNREQGTENRGQRIGSKLKKDKLLTEGTIWNEALKTLALLLAPFAPHITEEAWVNILGQKFSIHKSEWPEYDPKLVQEVKVTIAVQINGKLRATLVIDAQDSKKKDVVIKKAMEDERVNKWLKNVEINNEIFIPGKVLNIVV